MYSFYLLLGASSVDWKTTGEIILEMRYGPMCLEANLTANTHAAAQSGSSFCITLSSKLQIHGGFLMFFLCFRQFESHNLEYFFHIFNSVNTAVYFFLVVFFILNFVFF